MQETVNMLSNMPKIEGKVDVQYILEDGSVIHNKSKNTVFIPGWMGSYIPYYFCVNKSAVLYLTDDDSPVDENFPFLQGNVIGLSYRGSTSRGERVGAEIKSKRVYNVNKDSLFISNTYEWTASQIKGTIKKIAYAMDCYSMYGVNNIFPHKNLNLNLYSDYQNIYFIDYYRDIIYQLTTCSVTNNNMDVSATFKINTTFNAKDWKSITVSCNLFDTAPYSITLRYYRTIYDSDTGKLYFLMTYEYNLNSSSSITYGRALFEVDLTNKNARAIWNIVADSPWITSFSSPFNLGAAHFMVIKNGKIYINFTGYDKNTLDAHPEFVTSIAYVDGFDVFKNPITSDDLHFLQRAADIFMPNYNENILLNMNFPYSYDDINISKMFVMNTSNDLCVYQYDPYIPSVNLLDGSKSYEPGFEYNAIIDTNLNKIGAFCRRHSKRSSSCINRQLINGNNLFFVNISTDNELFQYNSNNNVVSQALTCFSVPESAQVRPENSGVRIVYELTISNQT